MSDLNLPSGQYYIRNQEIFAGRSKYEDKSLLPKPVYCPTDDSPQLFDLEQLSNGRYKISAKGAPTTVINDLLYALLTDSEEWKAVEWTIIRRNDDGHRSQYTIEKEDWKSWVMQSDETDHRIAVRTLIVRPREPPIFPASGLWNIQPLVD